MKNENPFRGLHGRFEMSEGTVTGTTDQQGLLNLNDTEKKWGERRDPEARAVTCGTVTRV